MNIECKGCHAFRFSWRVRFTVGKELLNLIYIGKIRVSSRIAYVVSMSMHAEMINSPNPHFVILKSLCAKCRIKKNILSFKHWIFFCCQLRKIQIKKNWKEKMLMMITVCHKNTYECKTNESRSCIQIWYRGVSPTWKRLQCGMRYNIIQSQFISGPASGNAMLCSSSDFYGHE